MALLRDCLAVKPLAGTCDRIATPIFVKFRASLSFAWLTVHWQTLRGFSS